MRQSSSKILAALAGLMVALTLGTGTAIAKPAVLTEPMLRDGVLRIAKNGCEGRKTKVLISRETGPIYDKADCYPAEAGRCLVERPGRDATGRFQWGFCNAVSYMIRFFYQPDMYTRYRYRDYHCHSPRVAGRLVWSTGERRWKVAHYWVESEAMKCWWARPHR